MNLNSNINKLGATVLLLLLLVSTCNAQSSIGWGFDDNDNEYVLHGLTRYYIADDTDYHEQLRQYYRSHEDQPQIISSTTTQTGSLVEDSIAYISPNCERVWAGWAINRRLASAVSSNCDEEIIITEGSIDFNEPGTYTYQAALLDSDWTILARSEMTTITIP